MPGDGIETEALDLFMTHARKKIPSRIVLAQVHAAQPVPVIHIVAGFRHMAFGGLNATGGSTLPDLCASMRRPLGINADIVTETRPIGCRTHTLIMGWKL